MANLQSCHPPSGPHPTNKWFTNDLTSICLLATKIYTPIAHANHFDKHLLQNIGKLVQQANAHISIRKAQSHIGIAGNEKADMLALQGTEVPWEYGLEDDIDTSHTIPFWMTTQTESICNVQKHVQKLSFQRSMQILAFSINMSPNGTYIKCSWPTLVLDVGT